VITRVYVSVTRQAGAGTGTRAGASGGTRSGVGAGTDAGSSARVLHDPCLQCQQFDVGFLQGTATLVTNSPNKSLQ
jgi:hypothetical protein